MSLHAKFLSAFAAIILAILLIGCYGAVDRDSVNPDDFIVIRDSGDLLRDEDDRDRDEDDRGSNTRDQDDRGSNSSGNSNSSGSSTSGNSNSGYTSGGSYGYTPRESNGIRVRGRVEIGQASYYGNQFQGKTTASGEKYDRDRMTCAHRHYNFGTILRVTNTKTGKSVEVRVNDRGPFTSGRVVDLSYTAAQQLDAITAGLINVEVEAVGTAN